MEQQDEFGNRLKSLREASNITKSQLGKMVGVSRQCVCNWENGNIRPSVDMLLKISKTFSVSTDYLFGFETLDSIDVSGLSCEQIRHIQLLVDDLRKSNQNRRKSK